MPNKMKCILPECHDKPPTINWLHFHFAVFSTLEHVRRCGFHAARWKTHFSATPRKALQIEM
jgi:hypothetical protein